MKEQDFNVIKKGTALNFGRHSLKKAETKMNISRKALIELIQETNVFVERAFQFAFIEARKQNNGTILDRHMRTGLSQSKNLFIQDLISQLEWKLKEIKKEVDVNAESRRTLFEKDNRGRKKSES